MTPKPPALKMSFDESWQVYAACHAANARQPCGLRATRALPRFSPYARGKPAHVTSGNLSISGVGLDRADAVHAPYVSAINGENDAAQKPQPTAPTHLPPVGRIGARHRSWAPWSRISMKDNHATGVFRGRPRGRFGGCGGGRSSPAPLVAAVDFDA